MSAPALDADAYCPLCRSMTTRPSMAYQNISDEHWCLQYCLDCGLHFLYPPIDSESLAEYYNEAYYGIDDRKFATPVEWIIRFFRLRRARAIHSFSPSGPILDIGCGNGMMLSFLKAWGYDVDGVELDTVASERARKNLGQVIFHSLDEIAGRQYRVICFWHSLEHLPNPGDVFHRIDRLLLDDGLLVVSAPHFGSIQRKLSGTAWLHLDLPRHLVHFDMDRFCVWLENRGYSVVKIQHFSLEFNVIDTLCFLFHKLGWGPTFLFDLVRNIRDKTRDVDKRPTRVIAALLLFIPCLFIALVAGNLFSALRAGSTVTIFAQKRCTASENHADAAGQTSVT